MYSGLSELQRLLLSLLWLSGHQYTEWRLNMHTKHVLRFLPTVVVCSPFALNNILTYAFPSSVC